MSPRAQARLALPLLLAALLCVAASGPSLASIPDYFSVEALLPLEPPLPELVAAVEVLDTASPVPRNTASAVRLQVVLRPPPEWPFSAESLSLSENRVWAQELELGFLVGEIDVQSVASTRVTSFVGRTSRWKFLIRYYDPELGRFTSVDPLGYVDGPSMYGFALNSPANYGDPLGQEAAVGKLGHFVITNPETGRSRTIRRDWTLKHPSGVWYALIDARLSEEEAEALLKKGNLPVVKPGGCPLGQICIGPAPRDRGAVFDVAQRAAAVPICAINFADNMVRQTLYGPFGNGQAIPCAIPPARTERQEEIDKVIVISGLMVGGVQVASRGLLTPRLGARLTAADFPEVTPKISQKQLRHIAGRSEHAARGGGSFLNSTADAQAVLDAYRSGSATVLGTSPAGFPIVRVSGVTGTNVNVSVGIAGQPTNVFMIKGTASPSVVPVNPNWVPR